MQENKEINKKLRRFLRSEMAKRGITYDSLVSLLNAKGIHCTKSSLETKVFRGTFSASFFIQSLSVMGCDNITISKMLDIEPNE